MQRLALAWMRRKKWQNQALAAEVVSLLAKAMGGKGPEAEGQGKPKKFIPRISSDQMMQMMGIPL